MGRQIAGDPGDDDPPLGSHEGLPADDHGGAGLGRFQLGEWERN
jgi:hypothetical protein